MKILIKKNAKSNTLIKVFPQFQFPTTDRKLARQISIALFVILVFFGRLSEVKTQEFIENDKLKKFNLKHFEVEYNGNGTVDKETGFVRVNSSENFNSEYKDAKDIAMDYLKNKLDIYGLNDLSQFRIRKVVESLTGEFVYFDQYINDIPVYQTNFTVFIDKYKTVKFVSNEFRNISKEQKDALESLSTKIEYGESIEIAKKHLNILEKNIINEPGGWLTYFESKDRRLLLTWAININCYEPAGNWYIFIDANDKQVVHIEDMTVNADISALVHNPNPLVTKRVSYGGNYVGGPNTNAVLDAAREQVILQDVLYNSNWQFYQIDGPYCIFEERENPPTQNTVQIFNNPSVIDYKRNQKEFATINCYYHINKSARRVKEFGYNIDNTGLKYFVVDPHGLENNNTGAVAHFSHVIQTWGPITNEYTYIAFKDFPNGVNASEDGDIIWHEHAHAIQHHFGVGLRGSSGENGSIKEGCSFYWPTSYKLSISNYQWQYFGLWGTWNGPWYVANYNLKYPNNYNNSSVHASGTIFSSALLKIRENIILETNSTVGRDIADKLFLEMHFRWSNPTNFYNAANAYLESSKYYDNGKWYCLVFNTLNEFGLISNPNSTYSMTGNFNSNSTIANSNVILQNVTINSGTVIKVNACNNITIGPNVTVKSGSTLEIDAVNGSVVIDYSSFTVEESAIFIIK